jgi:hypothetical protein
MDLGVVTRWPDTDILAGDTFAWNHIKRTRPWFNKLHLTTIQGLHCGPHGVVPDTWPVVSKPVMDLDGIHRDADIWSSPDDMVYKPGYFWCEHLEGEHLLLDLWIENCEATVVGRNKPALSATVLEFICTNFYWYTGALNLHCVGDVITAIHWGYLNLDR